MILKIVAWHNVIAEVKQLVEAQLICLCLILRSLFIRDDAHLEMPIVSVDSDILV